VRHAMKHQRMHSRIGGNDLKRAVRRGITVKHAVNVFSDVAKHFLGLLQL
jgi:hypothetical protein